MANMAQAIRLALHYAETHMDLQDVFGQDVGEPLGGVFTATQGIKSAWNTPLDERGIIGAAIGLALAGDRCVAEIQFCDYIFNTIDLLKYAGNILWSTNGNYNVPMTVMTPVGAGIRGSIYHSHSFDAWATRLPGWKVVMPSSPLDAYGLLLSAIEDPNPVLFLKPKALMRVKGEELIPGEPEDEKTLKSMIDAPLGDRSQWRPQWPSVGKYIIPIGVGKKVQEGTDVTIVTYGRHVHLAQEASRHLQDVSIEIIDLRSLYPYDWGMVKESILKTKRVIFLNEDTEVTNFGEHLSYRTTQELFYTLHAAPRVLAGKNLPGIGLHPVLEENSVPQVEDIVQTVREVVSEVP
ncbi:MAG: alpha-ketoacid dehydrogenase subunit beta [Bdellovibrionaceae bacterium]|nr:alpha-ketoacid dehydrogenase subunit beta [Pseudobdellovibrionaceae bacterium]